MLRSNKSLSEKKIEIFQSSTNVYKFNSGLDWDEALQVIYILEKIDGSLCNYSG